MKLSLKLTLIVVLISVLGTIFGSFFIIISIKPFLQKFIGEHQLEIARQTMDKIDRLLYERYNNLQAIAQYQTLIEVMSNRSPEKIKQAAKKIQKLVVLTGPWDVLELVDFKGKIVVSNKNKRIGSFSNPQVLTPEILHKVLNGESYYSDLQVRTLETKKPTVMFVTPIRDDSLGRNPVVGAVVGFLSWPVVMEILEDMEQQGILINASGQVIAVNHKYGVEGLLFKSIKGKTFFNQFAAQNARSVILSAKDGLLASDSLSSFIRQQGYLSYQGSQWILVLSLPTQLAFASANKIAVRYTLALIPIIGFIAGGVLFLMVRFVTRPIEALRQATEKIARGERTEQVPLLSRDEIGDLAKAFNIMMAKLFEFHESMEEKIKKRTGALRNEIKERKLAEEERRKLQTQLVQSEKMSAVGQLASGIAHEINNPLGVILGFAQSVLNKMDSENAFLFPLRSIEREAKRCKNLVQELLTFSRIGGIKKQECNLNDVALNALALIETQTKVKSIELVKDFYPDLPNFLLNSNQMQQVVINLCNNAIDSMPQGGILTVRTVKAIKSDHEFVEMYISDTGSGISKQTQEKIFEPFFTTKEVGKGTGLGLSLVYEIVQKHRGRIELKSEQGKGSVFILSFPIREEFFSIEPKKNRVLAIDDEPAVLKIINRALTESGLKVLMAKDGFEAGKLLSEELPDLVILDLFLPGINGFKICEMIRSEKRMKHIKILAISGNADEDQIKDRALHSGADEFLGKPFELAALRKKVDGLLARG